MKTRAIVLAITLVIASPAASASTTVKYAKQKAGQFCKTIDLGKFVMTPSGKLICTVANGATRARWSHS